MKFEHPFEQKLYDFVKDYIENTFPVTNIEYFMKNNNFVFSIEKNEITEKPGVNLQIIPSKYVE